jgi:hypothetical protein
VAVVTERAKSHVGAALLVTTPASASEAAS